MTGRLRGAVSLVFLLTARVTLAQAPLVSGVEIKGSSDPALVRYVTVKTGVPSDPETIRSSVLLLSAMDLFDDVEVEEEPQGDGTLHLVFIVRETPKVGTLVFEARSAETSTDMPLPPILIKGLTTAAGLRAGEPFREKSLQEATARMTGWLRANGYKRA